MVNLFVSMMLVTTGSCVQLLTTFYKYLFCKYIAVKYQMHSYNWFVSLNNHNLLLFYTTGL